MIYSGDDNYRLEMFVIKSIIYDQKWFIIHENIISNFIKNIQYGNCDPTM